MENLKIFSKERKRERRGENEKKRRDGKEGRDRKKGGRVEILNEKETVKEIEQREGEIKRVNELERGEQRTLHLQIKRNKSGAILSVQN